MLARWDDGTQQATDLDHIVQPGGSTSTTLRLTAPARRGRHRLELSLVQQGGRSWGGRTFTVDVR